MAISSLDTNSQANNAFCRRTFVGEQATSRFKNVVSLKRNMEQTKLHPVSPGSWGGRGASLVVDKKSVKIEFDCAQGEIRRQLKIDGRGNFKVDGFYKQEPFGPILKDNRPQFVPAVFKGKIVGKSMSLSVLLNGKDEPIAEYVVGRGEVPRITKCR